jgi:hypothetical protein
LDPKEGLGKHGFGKFSPLFRSKEHSNGEKHPATATKTQQLAQEQGTVVKNAMNFSNELVPMERVRCIMLTSIVLYDAMLPQ